ncbi:hypothetical protein Gpo141_00009871 [Globisporangium polare]
MAETPESSASKWGWDFSESPTDNSNATTENSSSSTSTSHTETPESNNDDDDKSGGDAQKQTQQQLTTTTATTGKPPKSSDRRRRHRENMIRYRRKKKATVGDMIHEEQVLAAQLHSMLDLHASQSQTYHFPNRQQQGLYNLTDDDAISSEDDVSLQELNGLHGPPTPMDAFVNVLTEKERLHEENVALRQHLGEFHKFYHQLQDTVDEEALDEELRLAHQQAKHNGDNGYWIKFLPDEVPFYFMPLTEQECSAYVAQTLTSVYAMQSTYLSGGYPGAHSVTLFDWTASLKLDVDNDTQLLVIRYEFTKTFRRSPRTVDQLVDGQWSIMHTPDLYQSIHRVPVKSKVLQKVNDHLSVVMWSAPEPEQSVRFRNVSVYSRTAYQNPQGHECRLIGMTGVPLKMPAGGDLSPPARTVEGDPVVYVTSGFMYTSFSQPPKEQQEDKAEEKADLGMEMEEQSEINVAFGGYAMIFNEAQARFLMVELGGTCVRLEHLLFPFRVLR